MCHLHYKLAKKSPGVTGAPSAKKVRELLREFDIDESGTLSEDEFFTLAARWYNKSATMFAGKMVLSSLISMLLLPGTATIMHKEIPGLRRVPKAIFKCVFGLGTYCSCWDGGGCTV